MILLNNNTLTVHYNKQVYSKEVSTTEITMVKVYAMDVDYQSIIDLCFPNPSSLLLKEGFWESDGSIYYKNIKVSIPKVLAYKLLESTGEEFDRLIKFWGWLSLNPNPRTRENLYGWVKKNGIQLTNGGLMILYRRVVKVDFFNTELGQFVKETYEKRRKNKKSTDTHVWKNEEGLYYIGWVRTDDEYLGNLKDLYYTPPAAHYTDAHSHTKNYVIGVEEREPRSAGDESDAQCSTGLHLGSQSFSFSGFGDTPVACVVNPCDILNSVEDHYKIRTCAMTPVAVLTKDCEWIDDTEVYKRIDACYDQGVERLEQLLEEADFEDFKKHEVLGNEWNLQVGFETVLKILN